ncbi:MFS transporter [Carnobacterium jeotgali]|uniref:MFS transporter n=1 Tax=Carnobacterium jeotgali TaxID=545534 RepID=UPI00388D7A92
MTTIRTLTIKYALLQSLYWMVFCSIYGFASVFLLSRSFENQNIGLILASSNILSVILQPTLGAVIDKFKRLTLKWSLAILTILSIALLVSLLLSTGAPAIEALLFIAVVSLVLSMQPFINSFTFEHINSGVKINFGLTRGAGSLAFALTSYTLGLLLTRFSTIILPIACIFLLLAFLVLIFTFPETTISEVPSAPNLKSNNPLTKEKETFFKRYPRFAYFLIGAACLFLFHTIVNTYLVQIIHSLGGNDSDFGLSLMITALSELPAMLGFSYLLTKRKSGIWLKVAAISFVIRSILFLLSGSIFMLNITQLFQGLAFALYIPASTYYVNQLMQKPDYVKGQAFNIGAVTLGSVVGSFIGGWLLDHAGVPEMLSAGIVAAFIGCLLLFYSVKTDI